MDLELARKQHLLKQANTTAQPTQAAEVVVLGVVVVIEEGEG